MLLGSIAQAQFPCTPFPQCLIPGGFGGGGSSGPSTEFDAYFKDLVDGDFKDSLVDPSNEFTGFTITDNAQMPISSIHLNSKNPCTGSTCPPGGGDTESQIVPGKRKIPLKALVPGTMGTQADYMWSTDSVNMSQDNLNSPQVVWDVSMFLAESAVAQGQQNAFMKAASLQTNSLLESLGLATISDKFEGSQLDVQGYFWCIQKELENGKGMAKAKLICGKDKGQKSASAQGPVGSTPGFTFASHPASKFSGGQIGNDKVILLTDLIFNEESNTSVNGAQLVAVRDSFKKLYGDIRFSLTDTSGQLGSTYEFVPATAGAAGDFYQQSIVDKFNKLRKMLLSHCEAVNTFVQNGAPSDPEDLHAKKVDQSISAAAITNDKLKEVSMPGFDMTAATINSLRLLYYVSFEGHNESDSGSSVFCDPLDDDIPSFAVLYNPNGQTFKQLFDSLKEYGGHEFFNVLYQISRLLALGEWLTKGAIAEQVVSFLTSGVNEGSFLEKMAKDLIYRTVGSADIKNELERVTMQLRQLIMQIYTRQDAASNAASQGASNIPR